MKVIRPVARKQMEDREAMVEYVTFPCDMEEVFDLFQVKYDGDLYFADRSSRITVTHFNNVMRSADGRIDLLNEQIEQIIRFLSRQLSEHPTWKGTREELKLSFDNHLIWTYCMKENYQPPIPNVKVWEYSYALTVAMIRDDTGK